MYTTHLSSGIALIIILSSAAECNRIDCSKYVYAPKCRGISAKRTNGLESSLSTDWTSDSQSNTREHRRIGNLASGANVQRAAMEEKERPKKDRTQMMTSGDEETNNVRHKMADSYVSGLVPLSITSSTS